MQMILKSLKGLGSSWNFFGWFRGGLGLPWEQDPVVSDNLRNILIWVIRPCGTKSCEVLDTPAEQNPMVSDTSWNQVLWGIRPRETTLKVESRRIRNRIWKHFRLWTRGLYWVNYWKNPPEFGNLCYYPLEGLWRGISGYFLFSWKIKAGIGGPLLVFKGSSNFVLTQTFDAAQFGSQSDLHFLFKISFLFLFIEAKGFRIICKFPANCC